MLKKNKALITGITGQDGSYLTEILLREGWEIHGLVRRSSAGYGNLRNIKHLVENEKVYRQRLFLHAGDLSDDGSIHRIIKDVEPKHIYNLGAQADVMESFLMPEYSVDVDGIAPIRILEAIKQINPEIRFYQASTSELFGKVKETPQTEETEFNPQSPYGWGKEVAFRATQFYRKAYNLFTCNGILFNHESERRGDDYVTRKVTKAVGRIKYGLQHELRLGNLSAMRDWGYAPDYMEAVIKIMMLDEPDDFIIATNEANTVKAWVKQAFDFAGLDYNKYVIQDPKLYRPAEVDILRGDYSKAKKVLGWTPKIRFKQLVSKMCSYDLQISRSEAELRG